MREKSDQRSQEITPLLENGIRKSHRLQRRRDIFYTYGI